MSEKVPEQSEEFKSSMSNEQPMSKNQMKKLARKQRILEQRPEKRKLERERRRQKRKELAKLREANCETVDRQPKRTLMKDSDNKFRVVIDMDFESFMTDDEIAKAAKQMGRVYALNRQSKRPCQLYVSSLKGKIRDRFAITCAGYTSWDVNMSENNYLDMLLADTSSDNHDLEMERDKVRKSLIYLTGDTENDLPDVSELLKDETKIFIIGGLVDHNRHKDLCYKRAQEQHIPTARLPIKQYVKLCQRHILSTVTVFEIMLNVLAHGDSWREAFLKSIPQRKINQEELVAPNKSEEATKSANDDNGDAKQ